MKKILIGLGIFVIVLIVAAVVTVSFVDFEKHKKDIIANINKSIPGQLAVGDLEVSMWKGLSFKVSGVYLSEGKDPQSIKILDIPSLSARLSLFSLLTGSPHLKLKLVNPKIVLERSSEKKINLLQALQSKDAEKEAKPKKEGKSKFLALLLSSKLSLEIQSGSLIFDDKTSQKVQKIEGFTLKVKGLGLGSVVSYSLKTGVKYDPYISGNVELEGRALAKLTSDFKFEGIELNDTSLILNDAQVSFGKAFLKPKGAPLKLKLTGDYKNEGFTIRDLVFDLSTLEFKAKGVLSENNLNFSFSTNKIELNNLKSVSPLVSEFKIQGESVLRGSIKGTLKDPNYNAVFIIKNGGAELPKFKPGLRNLTTEFELKKDLLSLKNLSFNMGESSLQIEGEVKDFKQPKASLDIKSPLVNLNEIEVVEDKKAFLPFFTMAYAEDSQKTEERDFLQKLVATGSLTIDKVKTKNLVLSGVTASLLYENESATLKKLQFETADGKFQAQAKIGNLFATKSYEILGTVSELDTNKFLTAFSPDMKDILFGKLKAEFQLNSVGKTSEQMLMHVGGNGGVNIKDGSFSTLKVGEAIRENLKQNPLFEGSRIYTEELGEKFNTAEARFTISNQVINLTNLSLLSPNYNLGLKGRAGFNQSLNLDGFIRFPANMINHGELLADAEGKVQVPFAIVGTFAKPTVHVDVVTPLVQRLTAGKLKDQIKEKVGGDLGGILGDIFKGK